MDITFWRYLTEVLFFVLIVAGTILLWKMGRGESVRDRFTTIGFFFVAGLMGGGLLLVVAQNFPFVSMIYSGYIFAVPFLIRPSTGGPRNERTPNAGVLRKTPFFATCFLCGSLGILAYFQGEKSPLLLFLCSATAVALVPGFGHVVRPRGRSISRGGASWRCPNCQEIHGKSSELLALEAIGGRTSTIGKKARCPSCGSEIDFRKLLSGVYDV